MSEHYERACDGCGADLTHTGNCEGWCLTLSNTAIGGGFVTSMTISPKLKGGTHHFCDLLCLDHWRSRKQRESALWNNWWQTWRTEKGKNLGDGITSYPTPPDDVTDPLKAEFTAAALAEFPMERPQGRTRR